jgi:hypothetical protein
MWRWTFSVSLFWRIYMFCLHWNKKSGLLACHLSIYVYVYVYIYMYLCKDVHLVSTWTVFMYLIRYLRVHPSYTSDRWIWTHQVEKYGSSSWVPKQKMTIFSKEAETICIRFQWFVEPISLNKSAYVLSSGNQLYHRREPNVDFAETSF